MRYIDADALLSKLPNDLPYKASVKRVLIQAPTEDVAPMSEVERLTKILDSYAFQYGTVTNKQSIIDHEKAKFAMEIFEKIERMLDNYHSACLHVGAIETYTYYEGGLGEAIAELKKKYAEGI